MKVALYIRFGNRPETITFEKALAERRLREYAEQNNHQVCKEVIEFASAQARLPKLEQLLSAPTTQVEGVLCISPTAICRQPMMLPVWERRAGKLNKKLLFIEST